jgi:hypothetical protein
MFPLKIKFSRLIDKTMDQEQIKDALDLCYDILNKEGADYFSRSKNRLTFENRFNLLGWRWEYRSMIDAGYIEITESKNSKTKVSYSITVIRTWVVAFIISLIVLLSIKEIYIALIVLGILGVINIIILMLLNTTLLSSITDKIKYMNIKN